MTQEVNDHLVMVSGKSATGKSASLMYLAVDKDGNQLPEEEQQKVLYLCTEAGKKLPFRNKFRTFNIIDPHQLFEAFEMVTPRDTDNAEVKAKKAAFADVTTIAIDSQTFLMDQYESQYVLGTKDTMKGWSNFAQYFKKVMQQYVAATDKRVVFTAHTLDQLNEAECVMETKIPVKGALKNQGIEAYFSCVISTKKVTIKQLGPFQSKYLTITEDDEIRGFKYVFQTMLTKDTVGERIRSPMGMWSRSETFIDNNIAHVFDRLEEYYA